MAPDTRVENALRIDLSEAEKQAFNQRVLANEALIASQEAEATQRENDRASLLIRLRISEHEAELLIDP